MAELMPRDQRNELTEAEKDVVRQALKVATEEQQRRSRHADVRHW